MLLLIHAIAAIPTLPVKEQKSTSSVINVVTAGGDRSKKAVNVSQSPITYVQLVDPLPPRHGVTANGGIQPKRTKGKKAEKEKHQLINNHELLNSLGLAKLPSPSNHHRKRLATQSRHVGRPDDSRVFIVKLPPNPHYYTSFKPSDNDFNAVDDKISKKVRKLSKHVASSSYTTSPI